LMGAVGGEGVVVAVEDGDRARGDEWVHADCWVSARMARKRCQWACLVEGRARLSCSREAETWMVSMMAAGGIRASSMAAEGETTGTISVGSLVGVVAGDCAAVISSGRIWSMVRFCEARTRSRPSRERARLRLRKLEIWALRTCSSCKW
jgi:hypothetical protein